MGERVVFLRSNPVDPDSRVEKEVNSLLKAGYKVIVLAWDRGKENGKQQHNLRLQNGIVPILRFGIKASFGEGMKNWKAFLAFQMCLVTWLIKNRKCYDIVHACDFDTAFSANIVCMITKKRLVFDIFDYLCTVPKNLMEHFIKRMEDFIINQADAVILCSEKRKKQIAGTKPKKLAIIHNSPATYFVKGKRDINEKKQIEKIWKENRLCGSGEKVSIRKKTKIAYIGILQEGRMLKEIAEVVAGLKEVELHIGGFGKLEDYFVKMSKKHGNIFFYGKLSYEETIQLESECDILTAIYDPSIENHLYAAPNKFYEGLMLGKPLIMVKGTGMSEIVEKYALGVLISYQPESFQKGVLSLIKRETEWERIGIRMKELFHKTYSWEQMEDRLLQLYKKL